MVKDIDAYSGVYGKLRSPQDDANDISDTFIMWLPYILIAIGAILIGVYAKKIKDSKKTDNNKTNYGVIAAGSILLFIGLLIVYFRFKYDKD